MSKILVVGCGYVGAATADLLHAAGCEVEGWTSTDKSAAALSAEKPYRIRAVDLTDAAAVQNASADCDAVIQCVSSRGGNADSYRRLYLDGARHLTAAFPDAALIFTSSTSVYAQEDGAWVTETSPAEPTRETARVLRETEDHVLSHGGIVARLAGIYGPGRSALLRKFLAGEAAIAGSEARFINQIHRDDAAAALLLLVNRRVTTNRPCSPEIYNVSDDHPFTERECYTWLAGQLNRPLPPTTTTPPVRKRGNSNKRVSSRLLQAAGWTPRFPDFATGMRDSILPALATSGA